MNTPVRVDLLGPDDELLSLVGRRAYVGDDPAGSLLALVAAAVDRPIPTVAQSKRRRRRIGLGAFATVAFLASGAGVAAAVSDSLPRVGDTVVALQSAVQGAAPRADTWDHPGGLDSFLRPVDGATAGPVAAGLRSGPGQYAGAAAGVGSRGLANSTGLGGAGDGGWLAADQSLESPGVVGTAPGTNGATSGGGTPADVSSMTNAAGKTSSGSPGGSNSATNPNPGNGSTGNGNSGNSGNGGTGNEVPGSPGNGNTGNGDTGSGNSGNGNTGNSNSGNTGSGKDGTGNTDGGAKSSAVSGRGSSTAAGSASAPANPADAAGAGTGTSPR